MIDDLLLNLDQLHATKKLASINLLNIYEFAYGLVLDWEAS